jgi:hypothetical protein
MLGAHGTHPSTATASAGNGVDVCAAWLLGAAAGTERVFNECMVAIGAETALDAMALWLAKFVEVSLLRGRRAEVPLGAARRATTGRAGPPAAIVCARLGFVFWGLLSGKPNRIGLAWQAMAAALEQLIATRPDALGAFFCVPVRSASPPWPTSASAPRGAAGSSALAVEMLCALRRPERGTVVCS